MTKQYGNFYAAQANARAAVNAWADRNPDKATPADFVPKTAAELGAENERLRTARLQSKLDRAVAYAAACDERAAVAPAGKEGGAIRRAATIANRKADQARERLAAHQANLWYTR